MKTFKILTDNSRNPLPTTGRMGPANVFLQKRLTVPRTLGAKTTDDENR